MKYSFVCSCGDVINTEANSREEAVDKIKEMMPEEAIQKHMEEKHPGEPVPTMEQTHMMIEQTTFEGDSSQIPSAG